MAKPDRKPDRNVCPDVRPAPTSVGAQQPTEPRSGQRSGHAAPKPAPADWGSDGSEGTGPEEGKKDKASPHRNGGMRYFREIDMADREDRLAHGLTRQVYSWRHITGPSPKVSWGDREAARAYLVKLDMAIDQGGWTSSEASGLYAAKKAWAARAAGEDPRYEVVGNRLCGLDRQQAADVRHRQILLDMKRTLDGSQTYGD